MMEGDEPARGFNNSNPGRPLGYLTSSIMAFAALIEDPIYSCISKGFGGQPSNSNKTSNSYSNSNRVRNSKTNRDSNSNSNKNE